MAQKTHQGALNANGLKFAVLVSRFNSSITERLLSGALDALERSGASKDDIEVIWVPGAWELPAAARALVGLRRFDALIALGCVIRGETPHFDYVAGEAARGLGEIASGAGGLPVAFGVLTTNTVEQAAERAGGKAGNKGYDAAVTAIEMANLLKALRA